MDIKDITVRYAEPTDAHFAEYIVKLIYESALQRGTGIAKRSPEYIAAKLTGGKSVVATDWSDSATLKAGVMEISSLPRD